MKLKSDYLVTSNKTINLSPILISIGLVVFLSFFSLSTFAQNSRPTPTPRTEIPIIVSRDSDSVRETVENNKSETNDSTETIKLPKPNKPTKSDNKENVSAKQKKMMLYLDLLTRTEQRAASLQKQLFDLLEKQNSFSSKIKQLEYQLRPEVIAASTRLTGSLRPEDLREQRTKTLELEKTNLETLLQRLELRRLGLEESVRKADVLVEKIRVRFDKIIEDTLNEDEDF